MSRLKTPSVDRGLSVLVASVEARVSLALKASLTSFTSNKVEEVNNPLATSSTSSRRCSAAKVAAAAKDKRRLKDRTSR